MSGGSQKETWWDSHVVSKLDFLLRWCYLRSQRTHGNPLFDSKCLAKCWLTRCWIGTLVRKCAPLNLALFLLLILAVSLAPRSDLGSWATWKMPVACCAIFVGLCLLVPEFRIPILKLPLRIEYIQLAFVFVLMFFAARYPQQFGGTDVELPPDTKNIWHIYFPILSVLLFISTVVAPLLAWWLLKGLRAGFQQCTPPFVNRLPQVDLFFHPAKRWLGTTCDKIRAVVGAFAVIVERPAFVLYWPALYFVFVDPRITSNWSFWPWWFWGLLGIALIIYFLVVFIMRNSPRLDAMVTLIRRPLFHGGPAVVSYLVIVLAILRLAKFSYVTTVLDGAPGVIFFWFTVTYLAFWVYEYGINRVINERLLAFLTRADTTSTQTPPFACEDRVRRHSVAPDNRRIQVHGNLGFVVLGHAPNRPDQERWQFYGRLPLFEAILADWNVVQRVLVTAEDAANRTAPQRVAAGLHITRSAADTDPYGPGRQDPQDNTRLNKLRWAVSTYFGLLNLILIGLLVAYGAWFFAGRSGERAPVISEERKIVDEGWKTFEDAGYQLDLRARLFDQERTNNRVVLLATSGGGTRAALYATSVLHGLHRADALDDVELISGVSGGSVSVSYYAAHCKDLKEDGAAKTTSFEDLKKGPWKDYYDAMSHDYIVEVLRGLTEYRVVKGTTIGLHLSESVERQYGEGREGLKLGELHDPKRLHEPKEFQKPPLLIFNTTVTGIFPPYSKGLSDRPDERLRATNADAYHSGARLVFVNFPFTDYPGSPATESWQATHGLRERAPWEHMRYVVVRNPNIELSKAACLSANFPPVFQNAGVEFTDEGKPKRENADQKTGDGEPKNENGDEKTGEVYWVTDGGTTDNRGAISLLYALRGAIRDQRKEGNQEDTPFPEIHIVIAEASRVDIDYKHDQGMQAAMISKVQIGNQLILKLADEVDREYAELQRFPAKENGGPGQNPAEVQEGGTETAAKDGDDAKAKIAGIHIHYLAMPSVLRMRRGMGTHWMHEESVTVEHLGFEAMRESEKKINKPVLLKFEQMLQLFFEMHPSEVPELPVDTKEVAAKIPSNEGDLDRVRRWIRDEKMGRLWPDRESSNWSHRKAWKYLLEQLGEENAKAAGSSDKK